MLISKNRLKWLALARVAQALHKLEHEERNELLNFRCLHPAIVPRRVGLRRNDMPDNRLVRGEKVVRRHGAKVVCPENL